MAQSNIRLFGTSSQVLTADDPQDNEEETIPATMMKVSVLRITTTPKMTVMTENGEEGENITPNGTRGTLIVQSLEVFPPQARKNALTSNTLKATLI